jgi:hypothetical protein
MITGHNLAILRKLAGNLPTAPYVTTYSYWDDLGRLDCEERWEYDGCRTQPTGIERRCLPRGKVVERQRVEVRYDWADQITLWGRAS